MVTLSYFGIIHFAAENETQQWLSICGSLKTGKIVLSVLKSLQLSLVWIRLNWLEMPHPYRYNVIIEPLMGFPDLTLSTYHQAASLFKQLSAAPGGPKTALTQCYLTSVLQLELVHPRLLDIVKDVL